MKKLSETYKELGIEISHLGRISESPVVDQKRLIEWARNFRPKKQNPFLDLRETTTTNEKTNTKKPRS
jgi:hypothetical protein